MIVCPKCKSSNLKYFKEFIVTKYYKLNKNNEPTNKIESIIRDEDINAYNYVCNNCDCIFGGSSEILFEEVLDE